MEASHVTYDSLVACLRQRHTVNKQAASFRSQLRYRRPKDNESLHDLLHNIRRLMALTFPFETTVAMKMIACDLFIQALNNREITFKIK